MIFLQGCTEDSDPFVPDDSLPIFKQNLYLPLSINNIWKYHVKTESENATTQVLDVDTLRHTDGTLLHVIRDGILNFPNNEYHEYYYGNREGNIYLYNSDTGTYTDPYGNEIPVSKKLIIQDSVYLGQNWISTDTFKVISISNIDIEQLHFENVYCIESKGAWKIDSLYYAKNVGIIKQSYEYRSFGWGKSELYDYSIELNR